MIEQSAVVGNGAVLLDPSRFGEEAHVWALIVACTEPRPSCLSWESPPHEGWAPLLHGTSWLDPVNRLWCGQKCTESASTLSREVTQGKPLTSLGHISQQNGEIPGRSVVRTRLPMQEMQDTRVLPLGREDPLEKEMAIHFSILSGELPWTEEPGGLPDSKESDTT